MNFKYSLQVFFSLFFLKKKIFNFLFARFCSFHPTKGKRNSNKKNQKIYPEQFVTQKILEKINK